jgi:hypothetical protein
MKLNIWNLILNIFYWGYDYAYIINNVSFEISLISMDNALYTKTINNKIIIISFEKYIPLYEKFIEINYSMHQLNELGMAYS